MNGFMRVGQATRSEWRPRPSAPPPNKPLLRGSSAIRWADHRRSDNPMRPGDSTRAPRSARNRDGSRAAVRPVVKGPGAGPEDRHAGGPRARAWPRRPRVPDAARRRTRYGLETRRSRHSCDRSRPAGSDPSARIDSSGIRGSRDASQASRRRAPLRRAPLDWMLRRWAPLDWMLRRWAPLDWAPLRLPGCGVPERWGATVSRRHKRETRPPHKTG